ncbi:MAG: S8 family serine peptidase [Gammaproteobacteria bacterium]
MKNWILRFMAAVFVTAANFYGDGSGTAAASSGFCLSQVVEDSVCLPATPSLCESRGLLFHTTSTRVACVAASDSFCRRFRDGGVANAAGDDCVAPSESSCQSRGQVLNPAGTGCADATAEVCAAKGLIVGEGGCAPDPSLPPSVKITTATPGLLTVLVSLPPPAEDDGTNYHGDGEFNFSYALSLMKADAAYRRGYFGQGVTIAVLGRGVNTENSDIAPNLLPGYNFVEGGTDVEYDGLAGNAAILAAGARGNGESQGIAPQASVLPLVVVSSLGYVSEPHDAYTFAVSAGAHIIQNSFDEERRGWNGALHGDRRITLAADGGNVPTRISAPLWRPLLDRLPAAEKAFYMERYARIAEIAEGEDVVFVLTGRDNRGLDVCADSECPSRGIDEIVEGFVSDEVGDFATLGINYGDAGGYAVAPHYNPKLLGKWLVVGGYVGQDAQSAAEFGGCGDVKFWCLTAPGVEITMSRTVFPGFPPFPPIVSYDSDSGPLYASSYAAGALAVLKSRLPDMPMKVIQALLLASATDLGEPGVDDVYGWGLINLENAATMQGLMSFVAAPVAPSDSPQLSPPSSSPLAEMQIALSPALSHIQGRLAQVSMAASAVRGAYYNAPLAGAVHTRDAEATVAVGRAAAEMARAFSGSGASGADGIFADFNGTAGRFEAAGAAWSPAGLATLRMRHRFCAECAPSIWEGWHSAEIREDWAAAPFFSSRSGASQFQLDGKRWSSFVGAGGKIDGGGVKYTQFGVRWRGDVGGRLHIAAEGSRTDEADTFLGSDFGALGRTSARTYQGRLRLSGRLSARWRGFASYERAASRADIREGGFLADISGVRARGWSLGLAGEIRGGDALRLFVRQKTALRGGRAILRHARADGSFMESFYAGTPDFAGDSSPQTLRAAQTILDLSDDAPLILAAGYEFRPRLLPGDWRAVLGLEHYRRGDIRKSAASFWLATDF